jgi:hypothetical protein
VVKQFLTILLLFVYSFSSVGATVKAHLCAGKVQKCLCGKASKTKSTTKDTCCAEKISFVKKQDLHQTSEFQAIKKGLSETTIPAFNFTYTVPAVLVKDTFIRVNSKKGQLFTGPPIYALDCLYLI